MPSEELKKLAEELKASREEAEITLQHIASKTRIDLKFLSALEDGNFEVLPEVYIRAFIKEYVTFCGLDPIKTLEKYELAKQGKSYNLSAEIESEVEPTVESSKQKKQFTDDLGHQKKEATSNQNKNRIFVYGAIGLILILIVASYFLFIKNSPPEFVIEKPFDEVLKEQNQRYEIVEDKPIDNVTSDSDSLKLSIKATDTCWVNIKIDNTTDKEFILYKNTSILVKAVSKFDLVVGNSGGISLELNDSALALGGNKGERKTFSVDKDGIINPSN